MSNKPAPVFVMPAGVTVLPPGYYDDAPPPKKPKKRTPKLARHSNVCDCWTPKPDELDKKICIMCDKIIASS